MGHLLEVALPTERAMKTPRKKPIRVSPYANQKPPNPASPTSCEDAGLVIVHDLGGCQNARVDRYLVKSTYQKALEIAGAKTQRRCSVGRHDVECAIERPVLSCRSPSQDTVLVNGNPRPRIGLVTRGIAGNNVDPFFRLQLILEISACT